MTQGNIRKQLIQFSVPFLLANLLQAFYNVCDMVIVGRFGMPDGISIGGVGLGGQVTLLVIQITNGFAMGGTVLIAQYFGAKKSRDEKETVGTLFSLFVILAILLTIVMLALHKPILNLLDTPAERYKEAADYLKICLSGTVFIMGYNAVSAILRGLGDSKRPLIFVVIATVINIVLDLLFVAVFHWNAAGAAWATVIAQAVSFIIAVIYLRSVEGFVFDFRLKSFRIYKDKVVLLVKIGFPMAIQGAVTTLSFLTLTRLVNSYGPLALDVSSIAGKINSFAILPNLAFFSAISAMAGQNIGAGHFDRAKKTMRVGMGMAVICSLVIIALVCFFPRQIFLLFGLSETAISPGLPYLRLISLDYLFTAVLFTQNGLISGSGHTGISLFNSLLCSIALRVPLAYLFAGWGFHMGLPGVALGISLSTVIPTAIAFFYIRSGRWKRPRIQSPASAA